MSGDQIQVPALGRPFALGMLYNAHKDKLMMDYSLWNRETIDKFTVRQPQGSNDFKINASDSIASKSSLLDIGASVKVSFLSGLIEVGGSASYLKDNKKFKNQSRVTLQYKTTTEVKRLSLTPLEAQNMQMKNTSSHATHVVMGILYGANAFFVFDSEKLDASSVQKTEVSMQAAIRKIADASVNVNLSSEEKAVSNKFTCKFYGDVHLESNPATFEEAVNAYKKLPNMLKENKDNAVPVKVWLTPLKNLDPSAASLKAEICPGLLRKAEHTLESMRQIEMRSNDALDEKVVESFPQIQKRLRYFRDYCEDYTKMLQRSMEDKVPLIREGTDDESSLEKLFDDQEKSPFSQVLLDKWLDNMEREITIVRSCVDIMDGIKIVSDQYELERELFTAGVEDSLCFVFTSLETPDPYLDQMVKYMSCHELPSSVTPPSQDHWLSSQEVTTRMRQKAREFTTLAQPLKGNNRYPFLVAALPNDKYAGATIYHYRDGHLRTEDFSKPGVPDVTSVTDKRDLIWYACDLTLDQNTANGYLTLSDGDKKATCGQWQSYPKTPERFDTTSVLCREALTGQHYWEVEWSSCYRSSVGVAVTYKGIGRQGVGPHSEFGYNNISWYFGDNNQELVAWHNQIKEYSGYLTGCTRIGVFLNWPAGTLSFYKVTNNNLSHLHTFRTRFTEPVYAGLWAYETSNYVGFCAL